MSLGGGSGDTVTTKTDLSKEQKALVGLGMPYVKQYADPKNTQNLQVTGQTTVPFNQNQLAGQNEALGAAGSQRELAGAGADATKFGLHDALYASSNPALKGYMDAAARPITEQLTEATLPAIRAGATANGQYGSSRQGIAEGIASGKASQAIGDTESKIANQGYQSGLDTMTRSLGLLPQTQGAQTQGALTTSGVGDTQQGMAQKTLDNNISQQVYNAGVPFNVGSNIANLALGTPGGGTSTTYPNTGGGLTGALGGAMSGSTLGNMIFPGAGGLVGGGLGALLGGFF